MREASPVRNLRFAAPRSSLLFALFVLAAYPTWLRGGTPRDLQHPLVLLGLIVIATVVWIGSIHLNPAAPGSPGPARWMSDPVFYGGLLFLGLIALQWLYAGRVQFFDPVAQVWTYSPPLRPGWPSAFTRHEAAEMLRWFFPAWAAAMAIRSGVPGATGTLLLWRILVLNASAVGILGMVQQQTGRPIFPFTEELGDLRFFASFGYENHAASFFVLMAALSAGLAVRDFLAPRQRLRGGRAALMLAAFAVNLAAAHFSLSRAGILLAWALVAVGCAWTAIRVWRGSGPVGRVNAVAGGVAILLALAMAIVAVGRKDIGKELASIGHVGDEVLDKHDISLTLGDRILLGRAALDMLRARPAFGVGGWGFRYLMPYSLPDDDWEWSGTALGKANVHNDPLQFLAEFGGVGAGLLTLAVVVMSVPLFRRDTAGRRPVWANPVVFFALAGLAMVWIHSLIDLPFRCPAVLLSWTLVLAGVGEIARKGPRRLTPGGT